ncbi:hypothetical protein VP01_5386g1 [Puccinia sorghi]|uniref:Uncharacterized protein n=1 Tax=Puccinia sorghi TaxID=27349 RepID=A0A0L6UK06_9BASI|nr:hypothetical protein VP01_5386g1 [Puccinia sorghi]
MPNPLQRVLHKIPNTAPSFLESSLATRTTIGPTTPFSNGSPTLSQAAIVSPVQQSAPPASSSSKQAMVNPHPQHTAPLTPLLASQTSINSATLPPPTSTNFLLPASILPPSTHPRYDEKFIDEETRIRKHSTTLLSSDTYLPPNHLKTLTSSLDLSLRRPLSGSGLPSHSFSTHESHTTIVPLPPPLYSPKPTKNSATCNCDCPALFHLSCEFSSPPIPPETLPANSPSSTLLATLKTAAIGSLAIIDEEAIQSEKEEEEEEEEEEIAGVLSTQTQPHPLKSPSTPLILSFLLLRVPPQLAQPLPPIINSLVQSHIPLSLYFLFFYRRGEDDIIILYLVSASFFPSPFSHRLGKPFPSFSLFSYPHIGTRICCQCPLTSVQ